MVLTLGKACCLIGGLTVAAFFLGLFLGYNNVLIFDFECSKGSKECSDRSFCNMDFKGIKGQCESKLNFWPARI